MPILPNQMLATHFGRPFNSRVVGFVALCLSHEAVQRLAGFSECSLRPPRHRICQSACRNHVSYDSKLFYFDRTIHLIAPLHPSRGPAHGFAIGLRDDAKERLNGPAQEGEMLGG